MMISLKEWAEKYFGNSAPCATTLRRWVDQGRFSTTPVKIGRAYFIPNTTTVSGQTRADIGRKKNHAE
jgi:hypothetical protein